MKKDYARLSHLIKDFSARKPSRLRTPGLRLSALSRSHQLTSPVSFLSRSRQCLAAQRQPGGHGVARRGAGGLFIRPVYPPRGLICLITPCLLRDHDGGTRPRLTVSTHLAH